MGLKNSPTVIFCFRELTAVGPCCCSEQFTKNCCLTKVLSFWVAQLPQILCVHVLETATALDSQDFYLCSCSEDEAVCLFLLEVLPCLPRSWEGKSEGL